MLAYNPKSRFAADFEAAAAAGTTPWYEVLARRPACASAGATRRSTRRGIERSSSSTWPAKHYASPDIPALLGDPLNPAQVLPEVALLARIESGQFDAGIFYKHEIVAHKLPFVSFPPEINLGDAPVFRSLRPGHLYDSRGASSSRAAPILFTVTIPRTVQNQAGAEAFVRFLLSSPDLLNGFGFGIVEHQVGGDRQPGSAGSPQPHLGNLRAVMHDGRRPTLLVFGAIGGLLLLDLVLPIANLLLHADWPAGRRRCATPRPATPCARRSLTSAITVVIMTLFGVPLGYVLARSRLPFKQLLIGLVFLPMVVPGLAGGILLLLTFGPYGIGRRSAGRLEHRPHQQPGGDRPGPALRVLPVRRHLRVGGLQQRRSQAGDGGGHAGRFRSGRSSGGSRCLSPGPASRRASPWGGSGPWASSAPR